MTSLITIRLYNDDGTPKTWASPKLSAIREKDWVKVLESVDMIEVSDWFYKYNFAKYNKSELYFFFIDWEQYDDVNRLDSYGNKFTRWKASQLILDEDKLRKKIWNIKKEEVEKDTIWEHIFWLENASFSEIEAKVQEVFDVLFKKSDELWLIVKWAIDWIKIPDKYDDKELFENITNLIKTSLESYSDNTTNALKALEWVIWNSVSHLENYNDSEVVEELWSIYENISWIYNKIDEFKLVKVNVDLNWQGWGMIGRDIDIISKKLDEINRKMQIVFTRLGNR